MEMLEKFNTGLPKFLEDIGSLHLNEELSDIVFIVNGERLCAHKVILAVRSDYFKKLLYGNLRESKQSEIIIEDVSSVDVFKTLLEYIYTGDVRLDSMNIDHALEVLIESQKYCLKDLEHIVTEKLTELLALENASFIFNIAISFNFIKLKNACYTFLDESAADFLKTENFIYLTQDSIVDLLTRDTFYAPEVEIFKSLVNWLRNNHCEDDSWITSCLRLGWISAHDVVSIVRPTNLINNEVLLNAIAQAMCVEPKKTICRGKLVMDKNVAEKSNNAVVLQSKTDSSILNMDIKLTIDGGEHHSIGDGDGNGIVIKLEKPHMINTIHMILKPEDDNNKINKRSYCYYIEISTDFNFWKKIVDYRNYPCLCMQFLQFPAEMVLYIRVVGTSTCHSSDNEFRLLRIKASYETKLFNQVDGFPKPAHNIARTKTGATVIEGRVNGCNLISSDGKFDSIRSQYTYHNFDSAEKIVIQLNQPFVISNMLLVLQESSSYKYYIEVSTDRCTWEMVGNFRDQNRECVQVITFPERVVVFIRIVGVYSSANDGQFRCCYFECPAVHAAEVSAALKAPITGNY